VALQWLHLRKTQINLAFYSLIRTFALKIWKYGKKKMALQAWATAYGTG
jgi:hypothetical protein